MASKVYLAPLEDEETDESIATKAERVFSGAGLSGIVGDQDLCAVKTHFGEPGDDSHVPPQFIQPMIERIRSAGGRPFFAETSTLYRGKRSNAIDHFHVAVKHGFGYHDTGCPVAFLDGIRGNYHVEVEVGLKHFQKVGIAGDFPLIPSALIVTHLTGHELAGLGGAIKNVAMGLTSRAGKLRQHDAGKPTVSVGDCTACGVCARWCPVGAIQVQDMAVIDYGACIGCGECLTVCPVDAVGFEWSETPDNFSEQMAEFALGILKGKESSTGFVTFIHHTTEECNCPGKEQERICSDIGILASTDPVAIDRAAADLVNEAAGKDIFQDLWPNTCYEAQLSHGEEIGLGSCDYELTRV